MNQMTIFDTEEYQPRFQAYLDHVGATHADEVNARHFIAWIREIILGGVK